MDAKIVMSLEIEEDILKDTESALLFQYNITQLWRHNVRDVLRFTNKENRFLDHHVITSLQ